MKFTTGQVISAGTDKLCCPIEKLYEIFNYLTGDSLWTHQLPRASRACEPWLKKQCPWLNELDPTQCSPATWRVFVENAERLFGKEHDLQPLPQGEWQSCDPMSEMIQLMEGRDKIIPVVSPDSTSPP